MNTFLSNSYFSFKALFSWSNPRDYILMKILTPIFHLSFFILILKFVNPNKSLEEYIIGNAFLLTTYNSIYSLGKTLMEERGFGTLKLITISSANKFLIYLGRGTFHIIDSLIGVSIGLLYSCLFFNLNIPFNKIGIFIFIIIICIFSTIGFGLMIGTSGLLVSDLSLVLNTCAILLISLTGANFPIKNLPTILQKFSYFLPLTRTIVAAKEYLLYDSTFIEIQHLIFYEFLLGIIYFFIGFFLLKKIEKISRTYGTLEIY